MHVLIVGLDDSLLREDVVDSDTRQRHLDYAAALADRVPGSHVYMVVHAEADDDLEAKELSEHLTVYPSNTRFRYLFFLDVLRIGRRIAREHSLDLVTTQGPFDDGLTGYLLAKQYDAAFFAQLRPSNLDDPYWLDERRLNHLMRVVGKWICRRAEGVRVVSETSRRWCLEELGLDPGNVYLNHISMSMLSEETVEQAPDVKTDPDTVLYVGRLAEEKDLPTLLAALEQVLDPRPASELVIAGDGPERDRLERLAATLGIEDSVTFLGAVPYEELPEHYQRAAVVVLPSLHENFGRVILEAFAYGTPVVSTDAEGPVELIDDGETGLLVPKEDSQALAAAVEDVLADEAARDRMGAAGKRYVRNNFDPEELVEELVETWVAVGREA